MSRSLRAAWRRRTLHADHAVALPAPVPLGEPLEPRRAQAAEYRGDVTVANAPANLELPREEERLARQAAPDELGRQAADIARSLGLDPARRAIAAAQQVRLAHPVHVVLRVVATWTAPPRPLTLRSSLVPTSSRHTQLVPTDQ